MKMEDLMNRLRESGDTGKSCLAAIIENEYRRMETEDFGGKGRTVGFIHGCLATLSALGEITDDEEYLIWKDMMEQAYGEAEL